MFYKDERLAVMIDGANLHGMSRALEMDIDFRRLRDEFARRGRMMRLGYYTTIPDTDDHIPIKPLLDWLCYNGFDVVTRASREIVDANGRRRLRGSITPTLIVDALEIAPVIDHFVLVSGDSDYIPLFEALRRQGKRTTLVSTMASNPPMVSDDLRRLSSGFVDLADLRRVICKEELEETRA